MVERLLRKQKVAGSIPVVGFTFRDIRKCMELSAVMGCMSSVRQCSLAVEHPLSKREVVGSNPAIGSSCNFGSCSLDAKNVFQFGVARLAQSVERQPFKLVVVGSSPTVGVCRRFD